MAKCSAKLQADFALEAGSSDVHPNEPLLGVTGEGRRTYLWIGNNAESDMRCYATLAGRETLRRLAVTILDRIGGQRATPASAKKGA